MCIQDNPRYIKLVRRGMPLIDVIYDYVSGISCIYTQGLPETNLYIQCKDADDAFEALWIALELRYAVHQ